MAGIVERVDTGRNLWTRQRIKNGRVIFRKNGKFTSARAYRAARSASVAEIESTTLSRAGDLGTITPRTQWIRGGRAGPLAPELLGEVSEGDELTDEQTRILSREIRFVHGFEQFWFERDELSREEAEDEFQRMIDKIMKMRTAVERNAVRVEFGLSGTSGFDARAANAA